MLRTIVICALGPENLSPDTILAMVQGGMNLAHLNMSHEEREGHGAAVGFVRDAAIQLGWLVGIMVDLSGPASVSLRCRSSLSGGRWLC